MDNAAEFDLYCRKGLVWYRDRDIWDNIKQKQVDPKSRDQINVFWGINNLFGMWFMKENISTCRVTYTARLNIGQISFVFSIECRR